MRFGGRVFVIWSVNDEDDLPLSYLLPVDVMFDEYIVVDEIVEMCEQPTDDDIILQWRRLAQQRLLS